MRRLTVRRAPYRVTQLACEKKGLFIKVSAFLRRMNFQDIPPIDLPQKLLDQAFRTASKSAAEFKRKLRKGAVEERQAQTERERLKRMAEALHKSLSRTSAGFPSLDAFPEFYQRLLETTLDPDVLRQSLAAVSSAARTVRTLANGYVRKLGGGASRDAVLRLKREAIGRLSSVVKRVEKSLAVLERARSVMRTWPDLKTERFTVCIAGFPNVGKSTLLNRMTGAKAVTKAYAFTTKTLNTGGFEYRHNTIQCVDTPGSLARPEGMNDIERQAYLAMKYAAHVIVYVYDLTEPYPLKDQERLEEEIQKYGKDVLVYVSKTDIVDEKTVDAFRKRKKQEHVLFVDVDGLKKRIAELFEQDFL